jgi:hypothetical protein
MRFCTAFDLAQGGSWFGASRPPQTPPFDPSWFSFSSSNKPISNHESNRNKRLNRKIRRHYKIYDSQTIAKRDLVRHRTDEAIFHNIP